MKRFRKEKTEEILLVQISVLVIFLCGTINVGRGGSSSKKDTCSHVIP